MDNLTREQRHKNMQNIRSVNTAPERLVAKEFRKRKIYFSQHSKTLIGKPDFIFRKKRVVVFVDSDFWHGHSKRLIMPKSNLEYWAKKIKRNRARDKVVNSALKKSGWKVLRFWEHDIKNNLNRNLTKVLKAIGYSEK
jgi:DNA mismatch endonuclease (patch repair protein)